jgi:predicted nucleic acid-binding protein
MTALIDANIVLDVLLLREPWLADSRGVWQACDDGLVDGLISAVTLTNIFYLGRRQSGIDKTFAAIRDCIKSFNLASVGRGTIEAALMFPGSDFEDNVQIACAVESRAERIVTRNVADFAHSPIRAVTPTQFLIELKEPRPPEPPVNSS